VEERTNFAGNVRITTVGGLNDSQSKYIERVRNRCLKIINPELSCVDALFASGLEHLGLRRVNIVRNYLDTQHPGHIIHDLSLLTYFFSTLFTRDKCIYQLPAARKMPFPGSFTRKRCKFSIKKAIQSKTVRKS
jgi:hypothetical protein